MIPLELFLKFACSYSGQCAISSYPEILAILQSSSEKDKLFYLEYTTAAKGPWVVWYPYSKWQEEQQEQERINSVIQAQYVTKDKLSKDFCLKASKPDLANVFAKMAAAKKLQEQIKEAEGKGLTQIAESLKTVLSNL